MEILDDLMGCGNVQKRFTAKTKMGFYVGFKLKVVEVRQEGG